MTRRNGDFTNAQRRQIRDRAAGLCEECGAPGRDVAHLHPVWCGGGNDLDNGRLLCGACHKPETDRDKAGVAKARRIAGEINPKTGKPYKSQWSGTHAGKGKLPKRGFQGWRRFNGEQVRKT